MAAANDTRFLSVADVGRIHANTIAHEGGGLGQRDSGALAAAVSMPRQTYGGVLIHPDHGAQAAAYLFHICQNHPFVDGNKRTALASALVFLAVNGVRIRINEDEAADITWAVARRQMDKPQLTAWMRDQFGPTRSARPSGRD